LHLALEESGANEVALGFSLNQTGPEFVGKELNEHSKHPHAAQIFGGF
jgi:hypothetical protein